MTKIGFKHSDETKIKMSISRMGHKTSEETKRKIGLANRISLLGKKQSQETIEKRRIKMIGHEVSEKTRKLISDKQKGISRDYSKGDKSYLWKGENISYRGLHQWIVRNLGLAKKCKFCGKEKTTPKSIHWANIDHKYKRNLNDYIPLCVSCHKKYDLKKEENKKLK